MELSRSQLAVVDAGSDPLLVIAGPGAGKTTVLSARIARLLRDSAGSHRKVLGITYTNVAAKNLRDRLERQNNNDALDRVVVSTFHGFATRVLQQHGSHIGLRTDFSIINELEDRIELLTRAAGSVGLSIDEVGSRSEAILRLLSRLYERCLSADEAKKLLASPGEDHLVGALFEAYIKHSIDAGQLEFSLLVQLCNRLLLKFKPIARQMRQVYEHICVDEFQDTNEMQYRLLEIIAGDDASGLLLLADQDQVLYQWNGASPSRLSDARERFKMSVRVLPTSYRCPENIVEAASRLISKNTTRFVASQYDSERPNTADVTVMEFGNEHQEAAWVAQGLLEIDPSQRNDVVVLARNRKTLDVSFKAATTAGVACIAPVAKYDFVSAPLVMLHSMLRLASQPNRQVVLKRLVTAFYFLTGRVIDADVLAAKAEEQSIDMLTAFFDEFIPRAQSQEFKTLASLVSLNLIAKKEFRGISFAFFAWVDALPVTALKLAYSDDYEQERATWEELERRHQGIREDRVTLAEFLRQIDLEAKGKEPVGCVRFLTVHGAKGLEFQSVFLVGAAEGQFPAFQATNAGPQSDAFEEERRSFFVAVTRTMSKLTLTYANHYFGRKSVRSRFIDEMGLPVRL